MERGDGTDRKTLKRIPYYPSPKELYEKLVESKGWPYKRDPEQYVLRDKSLAATTYLVGLRISETLRLHRKQFIDQGDFIEIRGIELSKSRLRGKQRREQYREGRLPRQGERAPLTEMAWDYIEDLNPDEKPYKFKPSRAWQILTALLPESTCHWLRAYCEDYLYGAWGNDLLAVADYVKVDPRTLQEYIRRRYQKYPIV